MEACESYEVHQTPVGREEDGFDAHTEQKTLEQVLGIRPRVDDLVQDTRNSFDRSEVEVDGHLLVLLRGVEQFVYDALLNMTNIL